MSVRPAATSGVLLLALLATACGPGPLYHWGHYEALVYEMYAHPGNAEPSRQIDQLTEDIATAQSEGRPVPPGVHVHLGSMYLQQGNAAAARREFETEKQLFPESTVFMDRLLAQMGAP